MKHEIVLSQWDWSCEDRCCTDHGTELIVNGKTITRFFNGDVSSLELVLDALGIDVDIRVEYDEYNRDQYPPDDYYEDDEEF